MSSDSHSSRSGADSQDARQRQRAILRLVLGQAQVFGAALAFVLLLEEGPTTPVIAVTVLTGLLTIVSLLLFRVTRRDRT